MKFSTIIKKGLIFDASGISNPDNYLWEKLKGVYWPVWQKVVFAVDCLYEDWDEDKECPVCPQCQQDYADCPCPGPTMKDEYDYKEIKGVLYARKKKV